MLSRISGPPEQTDARPAPRATAPPTECPRCGYDLRGVVAAWTEQCPLAGRCTECGLPLAWRDILHPSCRLPPWCVEAERPPWRWPQQVLTTIVRAARPRRYWSRMALAQPIRWGRLVAWGITLIILFIVGLDLGSATVAAAHHANTIGPRTTSPTTTFTVFRKVALTPWSGTPVAAYTWNLRTFAAWGGTAPRHYVLGIWLSHWPAAVIMGLTPLTSALAFAALPWSRRRAKVRARHVARIALHGMIIPFVAMAFGAAGSTWSALLHPPIVRGHALHGIAFAVLVVCTLLWWRAAVDDYLRMEHPWAVAVSASLIGLLAPVSVLGGLWAIFM